MAVDPAALGGNHDRNEWRLDGKRLSAELSAAITGGDFEVTIEGASTLTLIVRDSKRKLLRSKLLQGDALRLDAAGLRWELVKIGKQGDDLTLTFEDLRVAKYRRQTKPRKAARGKVTRAEFVKSLVDEVKQPPTIFVCPELHKKQPIAKQKDHKSKDAKDDDRDRGIAADADLTFRDGEATRSQLEMAERILDVAVSHDASERVMLALCMVGINETAFRNIPNPEGIANGPLQLLNSQAAEKGIDNTDPEAVTGVFLLEGSALDMGAIEYAARNPSASPAEIAQRVWGGTGFPLSTWTEWSDQARALLEAYGGAGGGSGSITVAKKYEYSRGKPGGPKGESTWEASLRLADEVGWRRFIVRKRFYFMAEEDLIRSRPRMTLVEGQDGVDWIDFDLDAGKKASEATVTCRSKLWRAPPGSTVQINGSGPANGRWLVTTVRRPLFSTTTTIELRRGRALLKEKAEPAPETVTRKLGGGAIEVGEGRDAAARAIYAAAQKISDQGRAYKYGGGHGPSLSSLVSGGDLDCSSSTSLALWMAGQFEPDVAWTSGTFASSYGEPGPGEFVTIYAHSDHVWIEFNIPGLPGKRFDTGGPGGGSGPRLQTTARSDQSSFVARHP